ncbi:unnamed protein product, partial [Rotaria sp. Silwood1]
EGIVVKDPWSVYKPNVRENGGWYKVCIVFFFG